MNLLDLGLEHLDLIVEDPSGSGVTPGAKEGIDRVIKACGEGTFPYLIYPRANDPLDLLDL